VAEGRTSGGTSPATLRVSIKVRPAGTAANPKMLIQVGKGTYNLGDGKLQGASISRITATFPTADAPPAADRRGLVQASLRGGLVQIPLTPSTDPWGSNGPSGVTLKAYARKADAGAACEVDFSPGDVFRGIANCFTKGKGDKAFKVGVVFQRTAKGWIYMVEEVVGGYGPQVGQITSVKVHETTSGLSGVVRRPLGRMSGQLPSDLKVRVEVSYKKKSRTYGCLTDLFDPHRRHVLPQAA
jgi:hypothetical protein